VKDLHGRDAFRPRAAPMANAKKNRSGQPGKLMLPLWETRAAARARWGTVPSVGAAH
jgi:hypothetical protein